MDDKELAYNPHIHHATTKHPFMFHMYILAFMIALFDFPRSLHTSIMDCTFVLAKKTWQSFTTAHSIAMNERVISTCVI